MCWLDVKPYSINQSFLIPANRKRTFQVKAFKIYLESEQVTQTHLFCSFDLDPMTFIYELDLYSLKMYPQTKNELCA